MKNMSFMIKPASSLCNLRCTYCFYQDVSSQRAVQSHGIMSCETTDALISNIFAELEGGDSVTIAFQGGEPTMAGLEYYEHFVDAVQRQSEKVSVHYAFQTNGIVLDDSWCEFLRKHKFLIGLSIDGYAQAHNQNRLDSQGKGTFAQALKGMQFLDKHKVEYNILCTVTNELARHPKKIWNFILEENIRYIQFTPCISDLDGSRSVWALTPKRFYSFYTELFPLWKSELQKGNYVSIKLFDDIVNQFVRREVTACGLHGRCQLQYVIEADGSTYPCDFYVLDQYNGGNLALAPVREVQANLAATGFLESRKSLPNTCGSCKYKAMCGGGCKRMASSMYVDSTGFCGYRQLLDGIGDDLCHIGDRMLRQG